jgi:hypothetical protein
MGDFLAGLVILWAGVVVVSHIPAVQRDFHQLVAEQASITCSA